MADLKRPSRSETDDDLLKQQEKFLKEKQKPSVKIVSKKSNDKTTHNENVNKDSNPVTNSTSIPDSDDLAIQPKNIVFDVKERDISYVEPFKFEAPCVPEVKLVNLSNRKIKKSKFSEGKKQTIFEQLLKDEGNKTLNEECGEKKTLSKESGSSVPFSALIDGSGLKAEEKDKEMQKIHDENVAKISSMSKDEILQHQEQLKNYLNPDIIKFIQNKQKAKSRETEFLDPSESEKDQKHVISNKQGVFDDMYIKNSELPDEILRKEGREDCDALILEKSKQSDVNRNSIKTNQENLQNNNDVLSTKFEIPKETKELLEESEKGHWRNMSKIEKEKLEWMADLPQPKPIDLKTGYTARFDFEGKLLSHDIDIPVYKGLHHHGKEPQVPGYSLEELFLLARSTLQSQRITALHTMAHILENNWYGMLDSCFDAPLLPMLLQAGIVPLLRWALDDTSVTSVAATVTAMHSLLICKADEACLSKTFCWLGGHLLPLLEPQDLEEPNAVLEELSDADLIKLDVVKGFLRIDILPRFKYVLQVLCPPPLVCKLIIEICARLAQHSAESAKQVVEQPGFLKLVFGKFLPLSWKFIDSSKLTDSVGYSYPMYSAMKLMRIISATSQELALHLVENYGLISNITFYLTLQPLDGKLSPQEVQMLMVETLKTWCILLCYGLATKVFLDLFPIFLKQLDFCESLNLNSDKSIQDFEYAVHLFKAFEAVAATSVEMKDVSGVAINAVLKKSVHCLKKWLWQFSQESPSSPGILLLAQCMNFVSTFYKKSHEGLTCEDWEPCSVAQEIFNEYFLRAVKSDVFRTMLVNLKSFSLLLNSTKSGHKRDGKTIVSLGSVMWQEDVVPLLKEGTPLPLILAFSNFAFVSRSLFSNLESQVFDVILREDSVIEYLKTITSSKLNDGSWFVRFETYYIYLLLKLSSLVTNEAPFFWHTIAVCLLPVLRAPDQCLIQDVFQDVIFNQALFSLNEEMLQTISSRVPVIADCYLSCFLDSEDILHSRKLLFFGLGLETVSSLSAPTALISKDWYYAPIYKLYESTGKRKIGKLNSVEILQVISSLQWIYAGHSLSLPELRAIPASAQFSYLCMVFLIDEDLFQNEKVQSLLHGSVSFLLNLKKIDLSKVMWKNLNGYDNLFLEMLNQFEAVSYGDHLFGNFLLLPLQQGFPSRWKKLLLNDHSQALCFLGVPLSKLIVPLKNYLEPYEMEFEVLVAYFKVLASGILTHRRCPLIYLMAVHHIHHYIFANQDVNKKSQKILLSSILCSKKKDAQLHVLLYSEVNLDAEHGFILQNQLSATQHEHLKNIMGVPVNL